MVSAGAYEWLKAFHVLMAVIWVGGAFMLQLLAIRVQATNDPEELRRFAREAEFVGTRVFTPASLILLLLGIVMVIDRWAFSQFWIIAAIVMFAFSFVSGAFYLGPNTAKLRKLYEAEGATAAGAPEMLRRLFLISRIELVLMVLIIFDMVLKPGSGL